MSQYQFPQKCVNLLGIPPIPLNPSPINHHNHNQCKCNPETHQCTRKALPKQQTGRAPNQASYSVEMNVVYTPITNTWVSHMSGSPYNHFCRPGRNLHNQQGRRIMQSRTPPLSSIPHDVPFRRHHQSPPINEYITTVAQTVHNEDYISTITSICRETQEQMSQPQINNGFLPLFGSLPHIW